jgi:protein-tyrosine phosphatase
MVTRVADRLFIGSAHDAGLLMFSNPLSIAAVINVALESDDDNNEIVNIHVPMEDGEISERAFDRVLTSISTHIKSGPVLIHCVMGVSRSAIVIALFLATSEGVNLDDALARLKKLRPQVNPDPEALASAKHYLEKRERMLKKSTPGGNR